MLMNILLVEDDLDLGNGVRIALLDRGISVVWVRRFDDAQRALANEGCDLVLLDLGLPDGDGLNLLAQLRREKGGPPVLILTARDALTDRIHGLDSGADDYLVKPFALEELLSRIRALARRCFGFEGDTLEVRGLSIHEPTMRVTVEGRVAVPAGGGEVATAPRAPAMVEGQLPSEIGGACVFLASPAAGYVTAIALPVDGGVSNAF